MNDLAELREACDEYIKFIRTDYCEDSSGKYEQYIFEKAVEWALGKDIWAEINKRMAE